MDKSRAVYGIDLGTTYSCIPVGGINLVHT